MIKFGEYCTIAPSNVEEQSVLWDFSYLAHVQGVGENHPTRMRLKSGEGKVEDLKVPGDAHDKEELDEDQHLVPFLLPAAAAAAKAINRNIYKKEK